MSDEKFENEEAEIIINKISELYTTHKQEVYNLYMITADIIGLIAGIKVGCSDCVPDLVADVELMKDTVAKLNKACIDAGKPPLCLEFEQASNAQIVSAIILHSRRIKLQRDLRWLDELNNITQ